MAVGNAIKIGHIRKLHLILFVLAWGRGYAQLTPLINCNLDDDELFCNITNIAGLSNVNLLLENHVGCDLEAGISDETFERCQTLEYGIVIVDDRSYYFLHFLEESNGDKGSIGSSSNHLIMNCSDGIVFNCLKSSFIGFDGFTSNYEQCDIYEDGFTFKDTTAYFLDALDFQPIKSYNTLEELPCDNIPFSKIFTGPNTCFECQSTCDCPFNHEPVCGSDGKTYANPCRAECAGTTWTSGPCSGDCINQDYLNLIEEAGVVIDCAPIDDPVCGCDGQTYLNSCIATVTVGLTSWTEGGCNSHSGSLICSPAINLACGTSHDFGTFQEAENVDTYCNESNIGMTGGEVVYRISPHSSDTYTFRLTNVSPGRDLDMFLLGSCDENDCIADSDGSTGNVVDVISQFLIVGRTYYLIVDTDEVSGSGESNYTISMEGDCDNGSNGLICSSAINLACGTSHDFGTFQEAENVDTYCNESNIGMTGGEVVYLIIPPSSDTYTFRLKNVSPGRDLDMFLLGSCDENDCIADSDGSNANVTDAVSQPLIAGRTYYLVVDTDEVSGSGESNYTITMEGDCIIPEICPENESYSTALGCPDNEAPVCGCDDRTYTTYCEALLAGVASWTMGACEEASLCCEDLQTVRLSYKIILNPEDGSFPPFNGDLQSGALIASWVDDMNQNMIDLSMPYRFVAQEFAIGGVGSEISEKYYAAESRDTARALEIEAEALRSIGNPYLWRDDHVNIYLNKGQSGEAGAVCSFPFSSRDREIIVVESSNSSWHTQLHELGHFFGLYHTPGRTCSRCHEDAELCKTIPGEDDIEDTLPDLACWSDDDIANHTYGKSYDALSSQARLMVHNTYRNIMSYHRPRTLLTKGQIQKWCHIIDQYPSRRDVVGDYCPSEASVLICTQAIPISCGSRLTETTLNKEARVSSYCTEVDPLEGGEVVFLVEPERTAEYTITLSGVTAPNHLVLIVLNSCDADDCLATSTDQGTDADDALTVLLREGQDYYVVVDTDLGADGAESSFQISITCDEDCECPPGPTDGSSYCGSDGGRYTSPCEAECAGVSWYIGPPSTGSCDCDCTLAPVCGNDGLTYQNACIATCYDVTYMTSACIECNCPSIFDPVCGSDGLTYDNACQAECAGVSWTPGICENYCDCPLDLTPVCGTNGMTYANVCRADCAGVSWVAGPCTGDCINKDYLDLVDASEVVIDCTPDDAPVCGCDKVTYLNKCFAMLAGVMAFTDGVCDVSTLCFSVAAIDTNAQCPTVLDAVCSCDGRTYLNECIAISNGITENKAGACDLSASPGLLIFYTSPGSYIEEGIITIPIKTRHFDQIRGFQFTLAISDAAGHPIGSIIGVEDAAVPVVTGQVNQAVLPILWDNNAATTITDDATLFNINVQLDQPANGCVILSFTSEPTSITANSRTLGIITPQSYGSAICIGSQYNISGTIQSESGNPIENTTIDIGNLPVQYSDNKGNYELPDLSVGTSHTIIPSKNDQITAGINIADVVKIRRHILAIEGLPSSHKIIAADVNRTGSIDVADVNEVSDLIIGRITEYTNGDAWRFIPAQFQFPDPTKPLVASFPESLTISGPLNSGEADFTGIKLGDVNASYKSAEMRSNHTVHLRLTEQQGHPIHANDIQLVVDATVPVHGLQFALEFDQAIDDIGLTVPPPFVLCRHRTTDQVYHFLISSVNGLQDLRQMKGLLQMKSKQHLNIGRAIRISHDIPPLAVMEEKISGIEITFDAEHSPSPIMSVHPNPFSGNLTIRVKTQITENGTISIYDVLGQQVVYRNIDLLKGLNSVVIEKKHFKIGGVYLISLQSQQIHQIEKVFCVN